VVIAIVVIDWLQGLFENELNLWRDCNGNALSSAFERGEAGQSGRRILKNHLNAIPPTSNTARPVT
jgi:hypothetical protein